MKKIVTGAEAKNNARWMDIATLVAITFPIFIIFLFGGAILIYSLTRYHPNPKVGKYIQASTYRFYGIIGLAIPIGTFIPLDVRYWFIFWGVSAICLIIPSILSLIKIQKDDWQDIEYDDDIYKNKSLLNKSCTI